jgi:uncharacterized protein
MRPSRFNVSFALGKGGERVVYNTLTGAAAVVDAEMAKALRDLRPGSESALGKAALAELQSAGFVVDDATDEDRVFEVQYQARRYGLQELWFTVMTTSACNLACSYCYQGSAAQTGTMGPRETEAITQFIQGYAGQEGCRQLALMLYGGEPLLNLDQGLRLIDSVASWARGAGVEFATGVVTNGTLFDRQVAEALARYPQRVSQITLDGPRHVHDARRPYRNGRGTYDDIVGALELHQELGLGHLLLRIDVDRQNVDQMRELLRDLRARGLHRIPVAFGLIQPKTQACASYSHRCLGGPELRRLVPPLWEMALEEGFDLKLRPEALFAYCGAQTNFSFTIDPHGGLYKCSNFVGLPEHRIASIGPDGSLTDLAFEYYDWMSRDPLKMPRCRKCKVLPLCGGGCAGLAFTEHGTFHREVCGETKYLLDRQLRVHLRQTFPERFRSGGYRWT